MTFKQFFHKHKNAIYLFLISVVGFLLRLINLKAQPFWGDEVLSLDIVMQFHHIPTMLHYLADVEVHPPLYYLMLHFWTDWFGVGTLGVKSLSLVFGMGCIIAIYYFASIIFRDKKIGLVSALITAVLPFQLQYSQEGRPYVIFCFFGIIAATALWQYFQTDKKYFFAGLYVLANIAGIYLHYSYLFILVAFALWWLYEVWVSKDKSRQFVIWCIVHALIFLAFSFWLEPFLFKIIIGKYPIFGWSRHITSEREFDLDFIYSQLVWLTKLRVLPTIQIFIAFVAKFILLLGFVLVFAKRIATKDNNWKPQLYLLWLSLVPMILFLFSPQSTAYTTIFERHVIFVSATIAPLLAWMMLSLQARARMAVVSIFLISLIPYDFMILDNDVKWDYDYNLQDAGDFINQNYQPGDIVLVAVGIVRSNLSHYLRDDIPVYELLPINYINYDTWNTRHTLGFIENEYQSRLTAPTDEQVVMKINEIESLTHAKRIWLYDFMEKDSSVHNWFADRKWRHAYKNIGDIFRVDLYVKK